jgi:hypothetical protein
MLGVRLGRTLVDACRHGYWDIVKWLINNTKVDVNYADNDNDNGILHNVISFNLNTSLYEYFRFHDITEFCRLAFVCGKDVSVPDNDGNTLLHRACYAGNRDYIGALLLAGADETIVNDDGETPVQLAVEFRSVKVLPLMDVSSEWKLLVCSHRLRRRTAVRVMMALVTWMVHQTPRVRKRLKVNNGVEATVGRGNAALANTRAYRGQGHRVRPRVPRRSKRQRSVPA